MALKESLILAGAALALLGASSSAQSQSGKVFARYNKPLRTVSLDLDTGTVTRGPAVHNKSTGTDTGFDNIDLGGFRRCRHRVLLLRVVRCGHQGQRQRG